MNSFSFQEIVRFGFTIFVAFHVLALVSEGAATNLDYPGLREYNIVQKPRSKPREIRGFKPHTMSTAIGFGKRQSNSYQPKFSEREEMSPAISELPERYLIERLLQYLRMNPEMGRTLEKNLASGDEMARPFVSQHYKKNKSELGDYYDE